MCCSARPHSGVGACASQTSGRRCASAIGRSRIAFPPTSRCRPCGSSSIRCSSNCPRASRGCTPPPAARRSRLGADGVLEESRSAPRGQHRRGVLQRRAEAGEAARPPVARALHRRRRCSRRGPVTGSTPHHGPDFPPPTPSSSNLLERDQLGESGRDVCHTVFCCTRPGSRPEQGADFAEGLVRCVVYNGDEQVTRQECRWLCVGDALSLEAAHGSRVRAWPARDSVRNGDARLAVAGVSDELRHPRPSYIQSTI